MINKLYIRLGRHNVDIMTRDLTPGCDTLDHYSRPIDASHPDSSHILNTLQDLVAERPELTTGFDRTVILTDTPARAVIPAAGAYDDLSTPLAHALIDADLTGEPHTIVVTSLPPTDTAMLTAVDERLCSYISRTFTGSIIMPALAPLIIYFAGRSQLTNVAQCYVNIRPRDIDIIITNRNRLMLANSFEITGDNDILYYITAACRDAGMRPDSGDMLYLCGDRDARARITPTLRQYIHNILPVIFPVGLYRASHASLDIPFDLITATLCE